MGFKEFREKSVAKVPKPWGLIILIINIFLPGWGTIISAFCNKGGFNKEALIMGII